MERVFAETLAARYCRAPRLLQGRVLAFLLVLGMCAGCGPGDPPPGFDVPPHVDLLVGSTARGGGALAVLYDYGRTIPLSFSECIGGTGRECAGGIAVYSSEAPGFDAVERDDPDAGIYPLSLGTVVRFELVSRDPGVSVLLEGALLDDPGDSVALPRVPDLHAHGAWQVAIDNPADRLRVFSLSFRMTTTAAGYTASEVYTLRFRLVPPGGAA